MAKIITTVTSRSIDEVIDTIASVDDARIHGYEIRADSLSTPLGRSELAAVRKTTGKTLLLTWRTEPGNPEQPRYELLDLAVRAGFDLVDVELHDQIDEGWIARNRDRIVLSHHDDALPDLELLLGKMRGYETRHVKLVPTPSGFRDDMSIVATLLKLHRQGISNLTMFGMGSSGLYSRYVAPRAGAELTFASAGATPAAPGQITTTRALECRMDHALDEPLFFALLGHPVAHSGSPAIHNAAYYARGVSATYGLIDTEEPGPVLDAVEAGSDGSPSGLSVTTPHKRPVFEEAVVRGWTIDRWARASGAVNTVYRSASGQLCVDNTDVAGFVFLLSRHQAEGRCLILGAGATARAAIVAAREVGLEALVAARDSATTRQTEEITGVRVVALDEMPADVAVVIDTIPADAPVPRPSTSHARLWIEASYGDVSRAPASEAMTVLDGRALLAAQAESQIEHFLEISPSRQRRMTGEAERLGQAERR